MNNLCFNIVKNKNKKCNKIDCKYYVSCLKSGCAIVESKKCHTLQEIGNILGITRMRVCQIEKNIIKKLKSL